MNWASLPQPVAFQMVFYGSCSPKHIKGNRLEQADPAILGWSAKWSTTFSLSHVNLQHRQVGLRKTTVWNTGELLAILADLDGLAIWQSIYDSLIRSYSVALRTYLNVIKIWYVCICSFLRYTRDQRLHSVLPTFRITVNTDSGCVLDASIMTALDPRNSLDHIVLTQCSHLRNRRQQHQTQMPAPTSRNARRRSATNSLPSCFSSSLQ